MFILGIVVVCFIILWIYYRSKKARKIIKLWADKNNYILKSCEYEFFDRGPFSFPPQGFHMVYLVKIQEKSETKNCWIKLGNPFTGILLVDTITKLIWDKEYVEKWNRKIRGDVEKE